MMIQLLERVMKSYILRNKITYILLIGTNCSILVNLVTKNLHKSFLMSKNKPSLNIYYENIENMVFCCIVA